LPHLRTPQSGLRKLLQRMRGVLSPGAGEFPGAGARFPTEVPNYLVQAILVTIFCCVPFGIVSIVYAAQVNGKVAAGDYAGAIATSNKAKTWAWVSLVPQPLEVDG